MSEPHHAISKPECDCRLLGITGKTICCAVVREWWIDNHNRLTGEPLNKDKKESWA